MDKNNYSYLIIGILLILIGMSIILNRFIHFPIWNLWPLFLILPAIAMFNEYFKYKDKAKNVVFPATILLLYGVYFLIINILPQGIILMSETWPLFILVPGIGFLAKFFASKYEDKFSLINSLILIFLSLLFFDVFKISYKIVIALAFIFIGIIILFNSIKRALKL